jgi:hypothetical protein
MVHFRVSATQYDKFSEFAESVGASRSQLLREMIEDMTEGAELCEQALLHGDVGNA